MWWHSYYSSLLIWSWSGNCESAQYCWEVQYQLYWCCLKSDDLSKFYDVLSHISHKIHFMYINLLKELCRRVLHTIFSGSIRKLQTYTKRTCKFKEGMVIKTSNTKIKSADLNWAHSLTSLWNYISNWKWWWSSVEIYTIQALQL